MSLTEIVTGIIKKINPFSKEKNYGHHILARFTKCNPELLDNSIEISNIFYDAAKYAKMTPTGDVLKKFKPQGLTFILGLEESHLSIHTWPEEKVAVIDVYTCGTEESCIKAYSYLKQHLKPGKILKYSKRKR